MRVEIWKKLLIRRLAKRLVLEVVSDKELARLIGKEAIKAYMLQGRDT